MVTFKISWGGGIWSPKMDLYDGAFERLFGLGGGNWNYNFQNSKMPGELPGGMWKVRFDWYITMWPSIP